MMRLSDEELSFYLVDSISYRSFNRLSFDDISSSALQANIVKITAPTWEQINHILLGTAAKQNIEKSRTVHIDSADRQYRDGNKYTRPRQFVAVGLHKDNGAIVIAAQKRSGPRKVVFL